MSAENTIKHRSPNKTAFATRDEDCVCCARPQLTVEVAEAHADGDHQRQDDAPVEAAAELPLLLLLVPGRLRLGLRRRRPLGLRARHPAPPRAPLAHGRAARAAALVAARLLGAGLRGER